jgi:nuclear pore complex protein Nup107
MARYYFLGKQSVRASVNTLPALTHEATANETRDDDAMEDDDASWQGNRRRKLWKSTCTRAALNVSTISFTLPMLVSHFTSQASLSDPERVLYASLAPSPQTSAILKSACRTWEDHLWAQISVMCEEKQSAEMIKLGGFGGGGKRRGKG